MKSGGGTQLLDLDASSLAHAILDVTGEITAIKLQKLVFYVQSHHGAVHGERLLGEDFQAWTNGPVYYPLYSLHRAKYKVDLNLFSACTPISDSVLDSIGEVVESFGQYTGDQLSALTHQESPWQSARRGLHAGDSSEALISFDDMVNFYGHKYL